MLQQRLRTLLGRREFLRLGAGAGAGLTALGLAPAVLAQMEDKGGSGTVSHAAHAGVAQETPPPGSAAALEHAHGGSMLMGSVDHARNGFDPMQMLVEWDYGTVSTLPGGQRLREYSIVAVDKEIEIAPGIFFPAWTYNARVPGPSLRATEGDRLRIRFHNGGSHPHTMHFHGIHPAEMDGVTGVGAGEIMPGSEFVYEFDAEPFGCQLYHCHAVPLKRHIHKGLYGAFVVDPQVGRPPAREFMMIMNAFDTNFDNKNEVYAVNTVGHEFARRPIPIQVGETVRVYLINVTEFDPINSIHIHAEFFNYYDHGTTLEPTQRIVDTIMQCQAQRGFLEFTYRRPGLYMFHAHQTEFAELGWMGMFKAVAPADYPAALAEAGLDATWDERGRNGQTVDFDSKEVVR